MLLLCCWPSRKSFASYPTSRKSASTPIMRIMSKIAERVRLSRSKRRSSQRALASYDDYILRKFIEEFDDWFMIEKKQAPSRRALERRLWILSLTYGLMMENQTEESRYIYFATVARAKKVLETLEIEPEISCHQS